MQFLAELDLRLVQLALEQDARDIEETLATIHLDDLETEDELPAAASPPPILPTHVEAATQTEPPSRFLYATSDRATYAVDTTNNRVVSWAPRSRVPYSYPTARPSRYTQLHTAGAVEGVIPTNLPDLHRARQQASAFNFTSRRVTIDCGPDTPTTPSSESDLDTTTNNDQYYI